MTSPSSASSPVLPRVLRCFQEIFEDHQYRQDQIWYQVSCDAEQALALSLRLETEWNFTFSPALLLDHPTPEAIARYLEQDLPPGPRFRYLKFQTGDPTLIFINGDFNAGGLYLPKLASCLCPMGYAVLNPRDILTESPPADLASHADQAVNCLNINHPDGPLCLAGYCNGGILALEMARRLRIQGRPILWVGLIEPSLVHPFLGPVLRWIHRLFPHRPIDPLRRRLAPFFRSLVFSQPELVTPPAFLHRRFAPYASALQRRTGPMEERTEHYTRMLLDHPIRQPGLPVHLWFTDQSLNRYRFPKAWMALSVAHQSAEIHSLPGQHDSWSLDTFAHDVLDICRKYC